MYKDVDVVITTEELGIILETCKAHGAGDVVLNLETGLSQLAVKRAFINGNHLIVIWNDDTKTVTTCAEGDEFVPYYGLMAAFMKKILGSQTFHAKMERGLKKVEVQKAPKKPAKMLNTTIMGMNDTKADILGNIK